MWMLLICRSLGYFPYLFESRRAGGSRAFFMLLIALYAAPFHTLRALEDRAVPQPVKASFKPVDRQQLATALGTVEKDSFRSALLHVARKVSPQGNVAHAYAGDVWFDEQWLTIEGAQLLAANDQRLVEYRQFRDRLGRSAPGQEKLARWCQNNKLPDQARVHWLSLLRFQPNHRAALKELKLQWFDRMLMTRSEAKHYKESVRQIQADQDSWRPRVKRMRRMLERGEAEERLVFRREMKKILDPNAVVPLLEEFTQAGPMDDKKELLQVELVSVLGQISSEQAAAALARFAVDSPSEVVRYEAIQEIKRKPLSQYVPLLLSELRLPIEASISTHQIGNRVINNYSFIQEGPGERQYEYNSHSYRTIDAQRYFVLPVFSRRSELIPERTTPGYYCSNGNFVPGSTIPAYTKNSIEHTGTISSSTDLSGYQHQQQVVNRKSQVDSLLAQEQVDRMNGAMQQQNERIAEVLTQVTGQTLEAFPKSWWNWWGEYLKAHPEVDRTERVQALQQAILQSQPRGLARGTWIWTLRGRRHVEDIREGDLVLSQDTESGQLTYKIVSAVAAPREQAVLRFQVDDSTFFSAPGHTYWVSGLGWQLAEDLQVGQRIHAVGSESKLLEQIESYTIDTYDLIVEDYHTYFIGELGLLAHDGVPVGPSLTALPGLSPAMVANAASLAR